MQNKDNRWLTTFSTFSFNGFIDWKGPYWFWLPRRIYLLAFNYTSRVFWKRKIRTPVLGQAKGTVDKSTFSPDEHFSDWTCAVISISIRETIKLCKNKNVCKAWWPAAWRVDSGALRRQVKGNAASAMLTCSDPPSAKLPEGFPLSVLHQLVFPYSTW